MKYNHNKDNFYDAIGISKGDMQKAYDMIKKVHDLFTKEGILKSQVMEEIDKCAEELTRPQLLLVIFILLERTSDLFFGFKFAGSVIKTLLSLKMLKNGEAASPELPKQVAQLIDSVPDSDKMKNAMVSIVVSLGGRNPFPDIIEVNTKYKN